MEQVRLVGGETAMWSHKLGRAEDLEWKPPVLSFQIERHGGTVMGSTRAELQRWSINTDTGEVTGYQDRFRQVRPKAASWTKADAEAAAAEIARALTSGTEHPAVSRTKTGKVQIVVSEILPSGPKETTEGRRQRLNAALEAKLGPLGYRREGSYWVEAARS